MRREFVLRAVSHNVQSLRQPESIELVISFMRERRVDIYAVQETWREGSGVETNKGHTFIRRNAEGLMRRGVGFVLSRRATEAWNAAGNVLYEPSSSTRVLGLKLVFEDMLGRKIGVCAVVGYRPLSSAPEEEMDVFDNALEEAMQWAGESERLVGFMDANGSVGIGEKGDPTLGPHGLRHRDDAGTALVNQMRSEEMCLAQSFFVQKGTVPPVEARG